MRALRAKYIDETVVSVRLDALSEMVTPVDKKFEEVIKSNMEQKGLLRPLVVVRMTSKQWRDDPNPDILSPPTESAQLLRIQCGNVRYRAAKELGYDAIDVMIFDDIKEAEEYCASSRKMEWS